MTFLVGGKLTFTDLVLVTHGTRCLRERQCSKDIRCSFTRPPVKKFSSCHYDNIGPVRPARLLLVSSTKIFSENHIPAPETTSTMRSNVLLTVAAWLSGMLVTATPVKTGVHDEKRDAMVEQIEKLGQAKKIDVSEKCCTWYRNVSVCEECSGRKEESKQVVKRAKDERCCVTSGMVSVCHECPSEDDAEQ